MTWMFLNGGGMRGGPLHHQLRGAPLVREAATAPRYRFLAVDDAFPALVPADDGGGAPVAGELYDVPLEVLRDSLLPSEPAELELGVIELDDGAASLAMLLRTGVADQRPPFERTRLRDITGHASWRAWTASRDLPAGERRP